MRSSPISRSSRPVGRALNAEVSMAHPSPESHPASTAGIASEAATGRPLIVVVVGNPNTGKTTLFNSLTGLAHRTGNYAGVTVDSAIGTFAVGEQHFLAIDLPGSYSLSPRAPDEVIAVRGLFGNGADERPDAILCVVDATNLDRNLYLLTQVLDRGLPVVVALTMVDVAKREGMLIDYRALSERLGVPIVPVHASRRQGITQLRDALLVAARSGAAPASGVSFPPAFDVEVRHLMAALRHNGNGREARFLAQRLLVDGDGFVAVEFADQVDEAIRRLVAAARERLANAGTPAAQIEIDSRYAWIAGVVEATVRRPSAAMHAWTERIDRILTHKVWGTAAFLGGMALVFQLIFSGAAPFMDAIDALFATIAGAAGGILPEGALRSLLIDGVIGGAGAVVVFVPQIAILFALITLMEDSGYMARAAFLMDRVMSTFGLSGRSFIPLLSSFACAVPGIMAARSIENRRDRLTTILIAPLMSCSARLPVYVLFIAAFIPPVRLAGWIGLQGLVLFAMYMIGMIVAPLAALLFKRTAFRGTQVPFLLEMPPYKVPSWRVVVQRVLDRSWAFVRRAGTIILATAILIWALSYYPTQPQIAARFDALRAATSDAAEIDHLDREEAGEKLRHSYLGRAGLAFEPIVRPLGWDWKIGMATLASFPAREVVIAALGTIYNLGSGADAGSLELRDAMRAERWPDGRPVFTPVVAVSIMVFFALCCQCAATLATIQRETGSWRLPALTFVYMTSLAYISAFAVYQIGSRLF
jgi:ferrous iron transport protein B